MNELKNGDSKLSTLVVKWYLLNGRKELPWRKNVTPYKIWISEIMLQQTQVKTVIPYYLKFIKTYPSLKKIMTADENQIIALWSGLGFYRRAKNIFKAKEQIKNKFGGRFPNNFNDLISLPGIGESTAGAIMSIAFNESYPILDANVKRVLTRHSNVVEDSPTKKNNLLWEISRKQTPRNNIFEYTQGIMDLGARICKPKDPLCSECPIVHICGSAFKVDKRKPKQRVLKNKPEVDINFTLAYTNNEYLLFKRNEKTFWQDLWLPSEEPKIHRIFKKNSYEQRNIDKKHKLTHLDLNLSITLLRYNKVFDIKSNSEYRWVKKIDIDKIGMPAPIKKIILEL
ncbi:MAG: A/G-specific adenine glycosylase [SAR86 cluster bacterium]|nr:A/G-specific adenine glycosylase [SAR86 cluster bacterium]